MRVGQVGMWAMAMVLAGGFSAAVAHADGVGNDPNITLNKIQSGGDPAGPNTGSTQDNPLIVVDGSGIVDFTYTGTATPSFFIEIIPGPNESASYFNNERFNCTKGPAASCSGVSPEGPLPAVEFVFDGPFSVNGPNGPETDTDIVNGDTLEFNVPEPNTVLLVLGGLGSLLAFGRRRKEVNFS